MPCVLWSREHFPVRLKSLRVAPYGEVMSLNSGAQITHNALPCALICLRSKTILRCSVAMWGTSASGLAQPKWSYPFAHMNHWRSTRRKDSPLERISKLANVWGREWTRKRELRFHLPGTQNKTNDWPGTKSSFGKETIQLKEMWVEWVN